VEINAKEPKRPPTGFGADGVVLDRPPPGNEPAPRSGPSGKGVAR
jgi:hypothetical protein